MSEKPENPPAFPAPNKPQGHQKHWVYEGTPGMTLRDYFAAAALQAIVSKPECRNHEATTIARDAYRLADSMLAERERI